VVYFAEEMHDPEHIWHLGRWIGQRQSGLARLTWSDNEILVGFQRGKIVSIEGLDPEAVAQRLGCEPAGLEELLEEAAAIASRYGIPETRTLGAVKEAFQEAFSGWLVDRERGLELIDEGPIEGGGSTISATHSIVELVLSDSGVVLTESILPDLDLLVRRSDDFLDLYAPLRLSEEADLVVAKITGQRTAEEIASRSPHGPQEVVRLIAALVAAGMLETAPVEKPVDEPEGLSFDLPEPPPQRKVIPLWPLIALVGLVLVTLVVMATIRFWPRGDSSEAADTTEWTLVVDMGCEPEELQRVLRKARLYPKVLEPVQANAGEGQSCWRLVWGRFPTRAAAEDALPEIPERLVLDGFPPHPIELPPESSTDASISDEE
jgi:hypothetical protein